MQMVVSPNTAAEWLDQVFNRNKKNYVISKNMIQKDLKPSASQAQNISPKNGNYVLKHKTSISDKIFTMNVTGDKDAVKKNYTNTT